MKREIKYRIWTGSIMMQPKSLMIMHQETVSGLTVGQWESQIYLEYTGLKDSKGTEIYESDYLRISHIDEKFSPVQVTVIWDRLCWMCGKGKSLFNYSTIPDLEIEVIGNIYENPELIK